MKHMKLIALLAAAMIVQGAHAGKKVNAVKKTGRVAWHTGQVVVGGMSFFTLASIVSPWQRDAGAQEYDSWKGWREGLWDEAGLIAMLSILGPTTFSAGIRGLNHELKISERAKKLADRIRKRKVSVA